MNHSRNHLGQHHAEALRSKYGLLVETTHGPIHIGVYEPLPKALRAETNKALCSRFLRQMLQPAGHGFLFLDPKGDSMSLREQTS